MDKKILPGEPINEVEALQRLQQQEDPSQRCYAAWWLGRMRSQHPEVIPLLLKALEIKPTATEAAIAVARSAARSLGKLHAKTALAPLIQALLHPDHGLREAAARSLGELGDSKAIKPLMERLLLPGADEPVGNGLHLGEPCEALLEAIGQICITIKFETNQDFQQPLERFLQNKRPVVASAASRALLQISGNPKWAEPMLALLEHPQLQMRRAALMDLGACGWRPAAEAISCCLAENSLKLIALRNLVEQPLISSGSISLGAREQQLLALMDKLL
ncbi:HEAT repeat domain-containing protein [Synechococcus sp. Cruz CV12-2-Slac-r]|uniref:HEAT repeat domain-containing protein n=1 Tax=Synechococcus sp. Cruz CV12-2-Slac-r TaxID=2823748 RepID=UPI0020CF90B0|nr:HEAT repeat domain-containing protein [Synechococcus sp. Cruz CV12-2-Slac-r]MCP9938749.1 HEAT repeat domain-containing protein [Synechococcus sp. Cruz CV12-2-Slac-r]